MHYASINETQIHLLKHNELILKSSFITTIHKKNNEDNESFAALPKLFVYACIFKLSNMCVSQEK